MRARSSAATSGSTSGWPRWAPRSSAGTTRPLNVGEQIARSRRDLLDATLRNPLLSYRLLRAKGVKIVDELPREVFRILVEDGRAMYFLAAPEKAAQAAGAQSNGEPPSANGNGTVVGDAAPAALGAEEAPAELRALMAETASGDPEAHHLDNKLQTAHTLVRMETRLRNTLRHARSSMEEQGVNILYLALGTLAWYESESSELARQAPLLLVPVELDRGSVHGRFKLRWTGEEIDANLSLAAKLKQDFGIRLPELDDGDEDAEAAGFSVDDYFGRVEQAVARQPRWEVKRTAIDLGFFSFSKLLIYKDLDPAAWPADQQPEDHPLVRSLFGADAAEPPPSIEDAGSAPNGGAWLDERLGVADTHQVLDSDSSQTVAVMDAVNGRNLVVQGPPGTGKSQTITNLVAECVALGKTVLFVAEKMAALQVVKRRLDQVGVGDACLELHSHTSSKAAVLAELRRTSELGRPDIKDATDDRLLLERSRERLNEYAKAVNSPVGPGKPAPQQLIGELARLGGADARPDAPVLDLPEPASWSQTDFVERREEVRDLQTLVAAHGLPRERPCWGSALAQFMPADRVAVNDALKAALGALELHWEDARRLRGALGLDASSLPSLAPDKVAVLLATAAMATEAPPLSEVRHDGPEWTARAAELEPAAADALEFARLREAHDAVLIPSAWEADVLSVRRDLAASGGKWWRFLSPAWRKASGQLKGLCRGEPPAGHRERIALLDAMLEARRLRDRLGRSWEALSRVFPGPEPGWDAEPWSRIGTVAPWLLRLHGEREKGAVHECVHEVLDRLDAQSASGLEPIQSAATACEQSKDGLSDAMDRVAQAMELDDSLFAPDLPPRQRTFSEQRRWLGNARDGLDSLQDVARFNQIAKRLDTMGLDSVAQAAASWADAGRELLNHFEHGAYSAWIEAAWEARPVLAEFDGSVHEDRIRQFQDRDRSLFAHNRQIVALRHWERVPRSHGGGQLGLLRREFQKKRRHLPLRKLVQGAGNAIQQIKPVFMMSPLSIAKFVPPASIQFDLVIFDEASQVRPMDAMGAIVRAKQAVVVGDSKQLPPTAFFDRIADVEEEDEPSQTADLESVLGLFCSRHVPQTMLRWHYRSRHESLIAVSNREFYDGRLVVFPSPDRERAHAGLRLVRDPDSFYQGGAGGRVNRGEAKAVARAVMRHADEAPDQTLGVAAFSLAQARRIEDELEILRRRDPSREAFFSGHPEEPFFVKNLESVQGDERDVILISVGYGRTENGRMSMNFGPLNNDGGERRLNVLITRARRRCVVHANFDADDLDLSRTSARGVHALKTFLHYARTGRLEAPSATGQAADSPFEEAVAEALRARGHRIEHQVGSAGFFVDLAVVDPARPGRYLLGIECDGATYHSARSARDRDRLRQQVLEGLGWTIHRIWSADWFMRPERETDRAEEAIRRAAEKSAPEVDADRGRPPPDQVDSEVAEAAGSPEPDEPPQPRAKGVRRGPSVELEAPADPSVSYRLAEPDVHVAFGELHDCPWPIGADWLAQVADVESPIRLEEAAARVARAAGLQRTGSRIMEWARNAARMGAQKGQFEQRGGFLWRPNHGKVAVRRRDGDDLPGSLRQVGAIAPEEIGEALLHAVRSSHGIEDADAVREALKLFGFKRAGANLQEGVRQALEQLKTDGVLEIRGGFLQVRR